MATIGDAQATDFKNTVGLLVTVKDYMPVGGIIGCVVFVVFGVILVFIAMSDKRKEYTELVNSTNESIN